MARRSKTKTQSKSRAKPAKPKQAKSPAPANPVSEPDAKPLWAQGQVVLKECWHGWFMFNRNDKIVGLALDRYGEWCEAELALLAPLLRPDRVVVDVGAFIGTHTVFFAKRIGPGGHVYAIEPQRHSFHMLSGNVALNSLRNVTCLPCIATAKAGSQRIAMCDPGQAQNFSGARVTVASAGEIVNAMCIDDLPLRRCDLIKIDVEGMEPDVLAGAREVIRRFRPVIYCENNTLNNAAGTIEAIAALGYRAWWHISSYYNPHNFFGNQENMFANYVPESNMLCTPPGAKIVVEGLMPVEGPGDNWQKALQRMQGSGRRTA